MVEETASDNMLDIMLVLVFVGTRSPPPSTAGNKVMTQAPDIAALVEPCCPAALRGYERGSFGEGIRVIQLFFCQAVDFDSRQVPQTLRIATPSSFPTILQSSHNKTMASRSFSKALRAPLARQFVSPAAQRRTFVSALGVVRPGVASSTRAVFAGQIQQTRGVKTIDFAGHKETVFGRSSVDTAHDYEACLYSCHRT